MLIYYILIIFIFNKINVIQLFTAIQEKYKIGLTVTYILYGVINSVQYCKRSKFNKQTQKTNFI